MKKLIASLLIAATFQASAAGFVDGIVVANGATLSGQTSITGSADVPQLLLRANASKTQAIAKISNSTGLTDYFRINADGTIYFNDSKVKLGRAFKSSPAKCPWLYSQTLA